VGRVEPGAEFHPSFWLTATPYFSGGSLHRNNINETLYIHNEDVLAFLAIAREGVQALATPATTTATKSRANFSEKTMYALSEMHEISRMYELLELKNQMEKGNQV
jgi:hypothetical protein